MYLFVGIYIFMALITLLIFILSKKMGITIKPIIYIIIFSFCLIGVINIIVFEKLNIMMNYETWLKKGMPDKFRLN